MKILITSDNHLGYNEKDLVRGNDSFNTFEEILKHGRDRNVDFILQGGDLFHYNKPSKNTYNKTVLLIQEYCKKIQRPVNHGDKVTSLNNKDVVITSSNHNNKDVVITSSNHNNKDVVITSSNGKDSTEISYKNIKIKNDMLPILAINGNHDDPSGLNNVCPYDILHSAELINFIGKFKITDEICLEPILIEKGDARIALYPLGYVKDRRLYRIFKNKKVSFNRPRGKWYNILIVHQNRVYRENEYLPMEFIPEWFDLVIFGHEHASVKLTETNFELIQVGSSVRTSLSRDEDGNKFVYFLNYESGEWKIGRELLR